VVRAQNLRPARPVNKNYRLLNILRNADVNKVVLTALVRSAILGSSWALVFPHLRRGRDETYRRCELMTLTFNLGGHGACRWCGSTSSIRRPTLKFSGLTVRKILHILCVCVSRPVTLIFDLLTLKLVCNVARVMGFPPLLRWYYDYSSSIYGPLGQSGSDWSRDLVTLTFDLGGNGACGWCGSSSSIRIPSLKFVSLAIRKTMAHDVCQR